MDSIKTITMQPDQAVSEQVAREYFAFRWKEKIKNESFLMGSFFAFVIGVVFLLISENPIFFVLIGVSAVFLAYSLLQFQSYKSRYFRKLKKRDVASYTFSYSDEGMGYKNDTIDFWIKWSYFSGYNLHDDAIYLNTKQDPDSAQIISQKLLGKEVYNDIRRIVKTQVASGAAPGSWAE